MLTALGGRRAWARAKVVEARIHTTIGPRSLDMQRWSELGGLRQRTQFTMNGEEQVHILDGDRGWTKSGSGPSASAMTPEQVDQQVQLKRRSLWDVVRNLARNKGLRATERGENQLLVRGEAGLELVLELDNNNRPLRAIYKSPINGENAIFEYGEWKQFGELSYAAHMVDKVGGREWAVQSFRVHQTFDEQLLRPD